jgi:hypothetical protein
VKLEYMGFCFQCALFHTGGVELVVDEMPYWDLYSSKNKYLNLF